MKKFFSAIAVLTAFAMVAVSCNDDDTKDEDIPVTEIKVTPATPAASSQEPPSP